MWRKWRKKIHDVDWNTQSLFDLCHLCHINPLFRKVLREKCTEKKIPETILNVTLVSRVWWMHLDTMDTIYGYSGKFYEKIVQEKDSGNRKNGVHGDRSGARSCSGGLWNRLREGVYCIPRVFRSGISVPYANNNHSSFIRTYPVIDGYISIDVVRGCIVSAEEPGITFQILYIYLVHFCKPGPWQGKSCSIRTWTGVSADNRDRNVFWSWICRGCGCHRGGSCCRHCGSLRSPVPGRGPRITPED